jgi:hypothetical protein
VIPLDAELPLLCFLAWMLADIDQQIGGLLAFMVLLMEEVQ